MTQKTRIEPLPPKRAGLLVGALYRIAKRRLGEVPEPFSVVAQHRRPLVANAVHETMVERASRTLPAACENWPCSGPRAKSAAHGVLTSDRCCSASTAWTCTGSRTSTSTRRHRLFSDDERAAIAYAEAITTDPHTVTDEQVAELRSRFGDAGVVELTYQIGLENMRARMNAALGITEQGFNFGDACRVPWATAEPQFGR